MNETRTPVEVTTRYATTVNGLTEAWAFVMDRIDSVGPDPSITISPVWTVSVHDMGEDEPEGGYPRHFSVVVEGMVEEANQGEDA